MRRVLVANRGEIACRVIRGCRELGGDVGLARGTGLAQAGRQLDPAGQQQQTTGVDVVIPLARGRFGRGVDDAAVADAEAEALVFAGAVGRACVADADGSAHSVSPRPMIIAITAMRMAMPCSTCCRISDCGA